MCKRIKYNTYTRYLLFGIFFVTLFSSYMHVVVVYIALISSYLCFDVVSVRFMIVRNYLICMLMLSIIFWLNVQVLICIA
jgi:hypothetical protein